MGLMYIIPLSIRTYFASYYFDSILFLKSMAEQEEQVVSCFRLQQDNILWIYLIFLIYFP